MQMWISWCFLMHSIIEWSSVSIPLHTIHWLFLQIIFLGTELIHGTVRKTFSFLLWFATVCQFHAMATYLISHSALWPRHSITLIPKDDTILFYSPLLPLYLVDSNSKDLLNRGLRVPYLEQIKRSGTVQHYSQYAFIAPKFSNMIPFLILKGLMP